MLNLFTNTFTLHFKTTEDQFYKALRENVKDSEPSLFDVINPFYLFQSPALDWKGTVGRRKFKITGKRSFLNQWANLNTLRGSYVQTGEFVKVTIKQSNWFFKFIFILFAFIYGMGSIGILLSDAENWTVIGILLHGLFMFSIFYFIYRKMIKTIPEWVKKEFIYFLHHKEHDYNK